MASLQRRSTGLFMLSLRYNGHRLYRSLETHDEDEAAHLKQLVEERLKQISKGVLALPEGATADDLWSLLRSGQLRAPEPQLVKTLRLDAAIKAYLNSYADGSKEPATLATETVHGNHLRRHLGRGRPLHAVSAEDLLDYVQRRQQEKGIRGGTVQNDTIRKELETFRLIWSFARSRKYVIQECPLAQIKMPKKRKKPPFRTWEQIELQIKRGGLTDKDIAELWDCLFLRETEIAEFLRHVRRAIGIHPRFPYIYPALCFCAYTGARRSEMFRCLVDDTTDGTAMLREKKRDRDSEFTFRYVPLSPELEPVLSEWTTRHPGGQFMFCKSNGQPLDDRTSREAFKCATKDSRWAVLRGYRVLRHSFASNLARSGRVCQAEIDELMGHQTEEMRRRYRHLFPEDTQRAVSVLKYSAQPCDAKQAQT